MEDTTQKIRKGVSDILAEIKASDYMNTITGLGAAIILLSVLYFVSHGKYWLALILTASSPISIVILAVITKMITNRISRLLHPSSEEEKRSEVETNLSYEISTKHVIETTNLPDYASIRVENTGDGEILCFAKLTKLSIIERRMIQGQYKGEKIQDFDIDAINPGRSFLQWADGKERLSRKTDSLK